MSSRRAATSWAALYAAMSLDVVQVFALDQSAGFTDPALAALAIAAFATEVFLLSVALRRVDGAVAYGLYGLGTAAVTVISIGWLGEALTPVKGVALVAVIVGAALLNVEGVRAPTVVSDGRAVRLRCRARAAGGSGRRTPGRTA